MSYRIELERMLGQMYDKADGVDDFERMILKYMWKELRPLCHSHTDLHLAEALRRRGVKLKTDYRTDQVEAASKYIRGLKSTAEKQGKIEKAKKSASRERLVKLLLSDGNVVNKNKW